MSFSHACLACGSNDLNTVVDYGSQPVCNQFLDNASDSFKSVRLHIGICTSCGQMQQMKVPSAAEIRSPHDWIKYIEPEGHLDQLVETIHKLDIFPSNGILGGITYKDKSTIDRFNMDPATQWILEPSTDLNCHDATCGIESFAENLTDLQANKILKNKPKADLIFVRHIFEHAQSPKDFLNALASLITPSGHIIIEVPDSTRWLQVQEYTMPWEEHVLYFTPAMLHRSLNRWGMQIVYLNSYPYATEDSLVAIVKPNPALVTPSNATLETDLYLSRTYTADFDQRVCDVRKRLMKIKNDYGPIAVFGAGHMSMKFINIFGLEGIIEFVVDDSPTKCGKFLPGNGIPIKPSSELDQANVKLCLMGLSTESQVRIVGKQTERISKGMKFASVSPVGPYPFDRIINEIETLMGYPESLPVERATNANNGLRMNRLKTLSLGVNTTPLKRRRYCAHIKDEDSFHEMFISLSRNTYIAPHKHLDGAESIHVVSGIAYLVLFTDTGIISETIALGPPESGYHFYYRINEPVYHTLIIKSEIFIFHESKLGPFNPSMTIQADFSPADDNSAIAQWNAALDQKAQAQNEWIIN